VKVAREQSFFSQRIDYQILPDGTSEPIFSVEPQRITIGLILDVTPQISSDAGVMMHVHPSLTELIGEDVFPPGASGTAVQANAPVLDIREVDTVVEIENGNRLVIGGLIKDRVNQSEKRVPILGRIPLVGQLFKQVKYEKEQVELVIVLTPTLIIGAAADLAAARRLERAETSAAEVN
jgi:type II secretory pathway component GspD/PulD (secretin)